MIRNVMLDFADDQGLLKVDGSASVHDLFRFAEDMYHMGRRHAVEDIYDGKGVPTDWAEDEGMEQDFWNKMAELLDGKK